MLSMSALNLQVLSLKIHPGGSMQAARRQQAEQAYQAVRYQAAQQRQNILQAHMPAIIGNAAKYLMTQL